MASTTWPTTSRALVLFIALVVHLEPTTPYSTGSSRSAGRYTREIRIKQGSLRGEVLEPSHVDNLQDVDRYLGIPYAAPPVGTQRFMPPGSPPRWTGTKMAISFEPVCTQNLPKFDEEPGKTMSVGRYNSLKKLLPYLNDSSEDCLYLNIYAPSQGGGRTQPKYPVIVYIHGESFEWNSGNPYDGSVLASYGHVILVTINFRLGILGFLKPGIGEHTVSNFGLLDQIAALQWVKENIGFFGGDAGSVTLMGHGTGAACANFLLVSPVSNGLFHRAILMSGTALSDWALTANPIQFTIQVAEALNCPSNDELADCLRKKRLEEIMKVRVQSPHFKTPFGPVIDGSVVPNEPSQTMGVYKDLFSRYELLYGVTEVESYHLLDANSLILGLRELERDRILREYVEARYEFVPDMALAKTLLEYNPWRTKTYRQLTEQHRDSLLEILSDARVASPLVQMADYHSQANPKSYFYVFRHNTVNGHFAKENIGGSVHGEELPFVFGVPMDNDPKGTATTPKFSNPEKLFSEAIMVYWTNFAKTGNPNAPHHSTFLHQTSKEWKDYDVDWPEYEAFNQTFLNLGIPPKYGHHYRKKLMRYWNHDLPHSLKNPSSSLPRLVHPTHLLDIDPRMEVSPPWNRPSPKVLHPYENFDKPYYERPTHRPAYGKVIHEEGGGKSKGLMDGPSGNHEEVSTIPPTIQAGNSSMALTIVVIIGVCFLVVNLCAFAALYYQRDRLKVQERIMKKRIDETIRLEEEGTYAKRVTVDLKGDKDTKEGDGIYEAVSKKTGEMSTENVANMKRWQRQGSSSTMDAHTKVREWIQQEIVQRCSPRFLRRTRQHIQQKLDRERQIGTSTETGLSVREPAAGSATAASTHKAPSSKTLPGSNTLQKKVKKVSVAVDATPAARSASVQKQVPIELSKSLDALTNLTVAHRPILKRSNTTMDETLRQESPKVLRRSTTSISLMPYVQKETEPEPEPEPLRIHHGHSHSEPVPFTIPFLADLDPEIRPGNSQSTKPQIFNISLEKDTKNYVQNETKPNMSTFPKNVKKIPAKKDVAVTTSNYRDINVTSRDSREDLNASTEDPLANMQRRNFPKVLPDLPVEGFQGEIFTAKQAAMKRRSLPPSNILVNLLTPVPNSSLRDAPPSMFAIKKPPPPPPRISSTLGRKPTNTAPIYVGVEVRKAPVVVLPGNHSNPSKIQRQEPKIIIKPTSTNPVTKNPKSQMKPNQNAGVIPRVTANNDGGKSKASPGGKTTPQQHVATATPPVEKPAEAAAASVAKQMPRIAEAPRKVAKKNSETSTDDDNSSNTGTIRRSDKK